MERIDGPGLDGRGVLPIILIAAVVQGWALYALHVAIVGSHWPATSPAWLLALYSIVIFAPLTVQMTAEHARRTATWAILAPFAVLFSYFGWHHGSRVLDHGVRTFASSGEFFPLAFVLALLWLLVLPFVQCRLASGDWRPRYESLFATAWRNKLALAEAALFTGLFWLLLFLWQALFKMLGIAFFEELFGEPIFIYPVTSLVFGCALYLIGSVERLTSVVLEQLLNVLKWLALIAGLILALFTLALVLKLPGMIESGERAISAAWLLWLAAVIVLLINAAYRDGSVEEPYPRWIAFGLRCVIPLTVVIALTAIYALYVRVDAYGFTVERVWACIVAAAALMYALGYAFAVRSRSPWMHGVANVNVLTAVFLITVIALALTPVLSPYRIAANSQFRQAQMEPQLAKTDASYGRQTPLQSLRFNTGEYGAARLRELAQLQDHPRAAEIREAASAMIARNDPWTPITQRDLSTLLADIVVYPAGRTLDAALTARIETDFKNPALGWPMQIPDLALGGVFADLNGDEVEEFVLLASPAAHVYAFEAGAWRRVGAMVSSSMSYATDRGHTVTERLMAGNVRVEPVVWRDLSIGDYRFRMNEVRQPLTASRPGDTPDKD